ncbi:MAG: hypothetical protein J2P36_02885 [Ktedonobacteraceae bacterium]|nr:hypothetical protein [Ktedonobacteraceae bacterium]
MCMTSVFVLRHEGHRWLASSFEQADRVKNLRAAGWYMLIHDCRQEWVAVIEAEKPEVRAPLLQVFVWRALATRERVLLKWMLHVQHTWP